LYRKKPQYHVRGSRGFGRSACGCVCGVPCVPRRPCVPCESRLPAVFLTKLHRKKLHLNKGILKNEAASYADSVVSRSRGSAGASVGGLSVCPVFVPCPVCVPAPPESFYRVCPLSRLPPVSFYRKAFFVFTMRLPSTIALVSGGASGLGNAVVRRLVGAGAKVVIADLNKDAADNLAELLGPSAVAARADCTSEEQVSEALDLAEKTFGSPVSAAISTAGTLYAAKVLSRKGVPHPLEPFERVLRVNVLGSFNVARLASQRMATREPDRDTGERGVIVNTASIAAFDGQAGQCAYSASKGAIVGMCLPLARDLAPMGIRVCTIAPGIFETPMMAQASDEVRQGLYGAIPFPRRFGAPDEFASLIEHVITNPYLNGETIRLDGGVRMT
jgi:3-hydroxyacyl-CoA dehydrogenase / 3-hydroxy-2-methylbutyryl-CoA dehydrogenase